MESERANNASPCLALANVETRRNPATRNANIRTDFAPYFSVAKRCLTRRQVEINWQIMGATFWPRWHFFSPIAFRECAPSTADEASTQPPCDFRCAVSWQFACHQRRVLSLFATAWPFWSFFREIGGDLFCRQPCFLGETVKQVSRPA